MPHYDQLSAELGRVVPELRIPVETEKRWWKGETPGQHVVFGNILPPFLIEELQSDDRPELLARAFSFLEELGQKPRCAAGGGRSTVCVGEPVRRAALVEAFEQAAGSRVTAAAEVVLRCLSPGSLTKPA